MAGFLDGRAKLAGRTAVVIGGSGLSIVAHGIVRVLAAAGVSVAFCDDDAEELARTDEIVRAAGVKGLMHRARPVKSAELSGFFDVVEREFAEGVDILVNVPGGVQRKDFMDTTPESWARDIHRNFGYALESIHRTVPMMRKRGRGSIITFTSIEGHRGAATFAVYAGARAAMTNFTRALAVELGSENIRVNTLAPDSPPPEVWEKALATLEPEIAAAQHTLTPEQVDGGRAMYVPMGRNAGIDDLANAVLFLASDLSASVTGTTLHVDGGTFASSGFINWPYGVGYVPAPLGKALEALFPAK